VTVFGPWLLLALVLIVTAFGAAEFVLHRRALFKIPIRIHVNGTRGKSSVTRLVAAGLRAAGVKTCAKTTGTLARMILPDGSELPIYRPAGANIIEQKRIVGGGGRVRRAGAGDRVHGAAAGAPGGVRK